LGVFDFLSRLLGRGRTVEPLTGLDPELTRVIVGLGNPGPEYAETRHNVGFRCVDALAKHIDAGWQDKTDSLSCRVAVINVPPTRPPVRGGLRPPTPSPSSADVPAPVVLAKPSTFMNRSGKAVKVLLDFLNVPPANTLVVYDDMDLPFGRLRLRERGSPGTHNGMRSVVTMLNTEDIPRLRIGIGQSHAAEATSHVLSEFSPEQRQEVDAVIERAAEAALAWAEMGAAAAMNRYNG
jgi:PTH1 family peptidyl-tRNA hydrolase